MPTHVPGNNNMFDRIALSPLAASFSSPTSSLKDELFVTFVTNLEKFRNLVNLKTEKNLHSLEFLQFLSSLADSLEDFILWCVAEALGCEIRLISPNGTFQSFSPS